MSLCVDIAGVGICQMSPPFSVFVLSVQQEGYQAWTVYRRYCHFCTLMEHLQSMYDVPPLPDFTDNSGQPMNIEVCLDVTFLENARAVLDSWLQDVLLNPVILRTQSMYHFLCAEANMSPPYLEIHWRITDEQRQDMTMGMNMGAEEQGTDEMDMEDMFGGAGAGGDNRLSSSGGMDGLDDSGEVASVFRASNGGGGRPVKRKSIPGKSAGAGAGAGGGMSRGDEYDHDDINIQSISLVESAEFLYDREGDGDEMMGQKLAETPGPQDSAQMVGAGAGAEGNGGENSPTRPNNKRGKPGDNSAAVLQVEVNVAGAVTVASVSSSSVPIFGATGAGAASSANSGTELSGSIASSVTGPARKMKKKTISLDAFSIIRVVGKGSFGKVFLVRDKAKQTLHALKVLKKDYIIKKNQVEHTKTENSVLKYVRHPYIVGCSMAFQTADKLFFVLDYCAGGELFFHLGKVGRFEEPRAKFYAAQITLALSYVHSCNIIYRDLKPENVLLDEAGNIRLTDFGLSKEGVRDHSTGATSFCGTPEYIAPEVLLRQGHGRAVDWWSLGALLYEMLTGLPPFYSRNREVMFEKIMKAQLTFPAFITPVSHCWTRESSRREMLTVLPLLRRFYLLHSRLLRIACSSLLTSLAPSECQGSADRTADPRPETAAGLRRAGCHGHHDTRILR